MDDGDDELQELENKIKELNLPEKVKYKFCYKITGWGGVSWLVNKNIKSVVGYFPFLLIGKK